MQRVLSLLVLSALPACALFDDSPGPMQQPPAPPPTNPPTEPPPSGDEDGSLPLEFAGIQPINRDFPDQTGVNNHIAVGGTHEVTLERDSDFTELDLPFDADTISPDVLSVAAIEGPHVTLRAYGSGIDSLYISDPASGTLFDYALYAMSQFSRAVPVGTREVMTSPQYGLPAASFVFAAGDTTVGVAYLNAYSPANRLVDTSATLVADGATQTRWDVITLADATVGMHDLTVTVGGIEQTIQFEVVDHADAIEELISISGATCFGAFTHNSFVANLAWTISVDGVVVDPAASGINFGPNCIFYDGSTSHQLTATAGGKTLTITTP